MGNRQRVLRGLGVRDEDVELRPLAWPDARGGCDVHAGIADRGGHPVIALSAGSIPCAPLCNSAIFYVGFAGVVAMLSGAMGADEL
jgi:hypothetical protein